MYSDPTKKRTKVVKLRFSDEEYELVKAFVAYTGDQPAVIARELLLKTIVKTLNLEQQ